MSSSVKEFGYANPCCKPTGLHLEIEFDPSSSLDELTQAAREIMRRRLSCRKFRDNAVRLQLHALAYNLANFMRTLALPKEVEHWSLTTLREKLVKIGAKVVRHGRYATFQLAEVAVSRNLFRKILSLIDDLRRRPVPA